MGAKTMTRGIFSGAVYEKFIHNVSDRVKNVLTVNPEKVKRDRFENDEEREKHKEKISRRTFCRSVHANHDTESIYSTLTFNNEWEVHTFEDAKRIRDNFVRVLKRKYPDAVIHLVMGRGKGTKRIHFHMISKGIPEEFLRKKWKYGQIVDCDKLREHNWYKGVDRGKDYTGLCNYLFDHWTNEVGGHRWFQTKNARKPDIEEPTELSANEGYSEKNPPAAPKGYMLVETEATKYGYLYFKYVVIPPKPKRTRAA